MTWETDLLTVIQDFLRARPASRLALELPTRVVKGKLQMVYNLANDSIDTITIKATDAAGATEPLPSGDTFTVSNSDPAALNAVIGKDAAGNPALVINALVQTTSTPISLVVGDSAGLMTAPLQVNIVNDLAPKTLVLDVADATHAPQPVPVTPAAGPTTSPAT